MKTLILELSHSLKINDLDYPDKLGQARNRCELSWQREAREASRG